MLRSLPLILALSVPHLAHASGLGLLSKLGKVGSKGGSAGLKAGKAAAVGKAAAGVTGVVAAERAGLLFAGMTDDAARSAAFVAKTPQGEVVLVTRAGGQSVHSAESLGLAAERIAPEGTTASVFIDASAAGSPEVLAKLPLDAELTLVKGSQKLPVRRMSDGKGSFDFLVDTADGAVDLAGFVSEGDEESGWGAFLIGLAVILGVIGLVVWRKNRAAEPELA